MGGFRVQGSDRRVAAGLARRFPRRLSLLAIAASSTCRTRSCRPARATSGRRKNSRRDGPQNSDRPAGPHRPDSRSADSGFGKSGLARQRQSRRRGLVAGPCRASIRPPRGLHGTSGGSGCSRGAGPWRRTNQTAGMKTSAASRAPKSSTPPRPSRPPTPRPAAP